MRHILMKARFYIPIRFLLKPHSLLPCRITFAKKFSDVSQQPTNKSESSKQQQNNLIPIGDITSTITNLRLGNFGLKALNIAQNTVEYFKEYFYRPYITFADCAYSNYSAEELNKWTQDLVLQYKNKLNKTADIGNRIGGDLSIVEEKEIELTLDDIHDTNVNQISYFIHHNLDKSFSVDSMKYYLQRFILPGVINAIIGEKLDLVTNWLDPSSMQLIRQFSAAQAQLKRNPFIYHIIDVSDPIGIKQNGEYHLMFTFSLVYCFQYKDGEKTKVIDKRISLEMKAERDEYPDSPLSWKIIQPAHLLYLLSDPEAQEI